MNRQPIDVERMNELMNAVVSGVSIEDACETLDERSYYRELAANYRRMQRERVMPWPISDWP